MTLRLLIERARHTLEARTPTADEIEDWWTHLSPGTVSSIAKRVRLTTTDIRRWNARDWAYAMDYYVRVELGNPRGYDRGRNV